MARSNHDEYSPCDAFGYYARIYQETGECAFQKEYYHSSDTGTVYTKTNRVPCFEGGLPLNQWIGMRFKVLTVPGEPNVVLSLYVDEHANGNWVLKHLLTDTPGSWLSTTTKTVPSECPQNDGDTVLRPGNVNFLRSDGSIETEVHWKDVSMINSLSQPTDPQPTDVPTPEPTHNPTAIPTHGPTSQPTNPPTLQPVHAGPDPTCSTGFLDNDVCCPAECGTCGGPGCSDLPGGSENCCTSSVIASGRSCNVYPPPCLVAEADPTCATGIQGSKNACCPMECTACGGGGCSRLPGGSENCCSNQVSGSGRSCDLYPPPCVMSDFESTN